MILVTLFVAQFHHAMMCRHPAATAEPLDTSYSIETDSSHSGYVLIGKPADMEIDPNVSSYSAHVWIKPAATGYQQAIISKGFSHTPNISAFLALDSDGSVYTYLGNVAATGGYVGDLAWHDVGFTATAGTGRLYVDGVQVGSSFAIGLEGTTGSTGADWLLGCSRYDSNADCGFPFSGRMQNATFWDSGLSARAMRELHGDGAPVDPTTHSQAIHLKHWWRAGENVTVPSVFDSVGAATGTMTNYAGIGLAKMSPIYAPTGLTPLVEDVDCDLHFNATSWGGTGDWGAASGGWTAVKQGSPTRSETSQFSGHYQANTAGAGWFRVANDAAHVVGPTGALTYVIRMNPGALNVTGGFFFGYDASVYGLSNLLVFNQNYSHDVAAKLTQILGAGDYLSAGQTNSQHANSYVELVVTIDMAAPRVRVYANGRLLDTDTTSSGAYGAYTTAPLGIGGIAYSDTGGYSGGADGQSIMEVSRYRREFSQDEVAQRAAEFCALKGYVSDVAP